MNQFLLGMAKAFDFWGVLSRDVPMLTDAEALRQDWEMVGQDMRKAIEAVVAEAEAQARSNTE